MLYIFGFISFHKRAIDDYKYRFSPRSGVKTVKWFFFWKNQMSHYYNSKLWPEIKKPTSVIKISHPERRTTYKGNILACFNLRCWKLATSMTKELHSCFYQLRTCVIIESVLGVRFQRGLFSPLLSPHIQVFIYAMWDFNLFHLCIFHIDFNSPLLTFWFWFWFCLSTGICYIFNGSYACLEQLTWEEIYVYVFPWKRMRRFCGIWKGNFLFNCLF